MRVSLTLLLLAFLTACASPRTPLEVTRARLAEALTPGARTAAAAARLHDARTAPLGDGRVRPMPRDVRTWDGLAAGVVAGRDPRFRDEMVTLAASLDAPFAAEVVEAARRVAAAGLHGEPHRTVLVVLWPAGPATDGLSRIRHLPLWPDTLRVATFVVGPEAPDGAEALDPEGTAGEALVARLAAAVLARAHRDPARPDTLRPSR